ncbi:NAD-dependent epimerase/dehydratase family protein [bacterium]|nr:MAG: NAD-dependent epimerase/dehydratase family protein [bacterium]
MRILITGSSGFVGKNLLHYLEKDNECNFLSRNQLQLMSPDFVNQNEVIVHLAGKAHDLKKVSDPEEYYQVNFQLTKNLYDAFLKSDAKKFIFVSSVKAAADQVAGILTEETSANPETHYGKSKLMAEQYIQSQPLPQGKSYYILRPCMIHGPGNKGNLNLLYQVVKKGIPYPLAGFQNKRSFLSIENLCFIMHELIKRDTIESGVYQVADDEALSTSEVVSILAASLNKKARLWKISPKLIVFFAKVGDRLHLPLTTERLNKLTESYIVSNAKIKAAINQELPLGAKQGLQITAASFSKV